MCKSPFTRIAIPELYAYRLFPKEKLRSYVNGAFMLGPSQGDFADYVISQVHSKYPKIFQDVMDGIESVPCGKCIECRIAESKRWAQRAVAESLVSENCIFLTLTYDDEHLPPMVYSYNRVDFKYGLYSPLVLSDVQNFLKRLRSKIKYDHDLDNVRVLYCGEYGPRTYRPHYHLLLFNCPVDDLELFRTNSLSGRTYSYLTSKKLEKLWNNGFITIGEVNWDTCSYVARYVLKKFTPLEEDDYNRLCTENGALPLPPEFRIASRRPGLGRPFYELHKDEIYKYDKVNLPNGKTVQPCSYFDNLYDLEDPELLAEIKKQRKLKVGYRKLNELKDIPPDELAAYQANKSKKFEKSIKKLKRTL